ncbi:MAG TPA: hypothetical protein VHV10_11055, partial [Ktedonobacteraceae bacterium]|nr:hypothetical protein [Ktedonobacteraceae bacterium]
MLGNISHSHHHLYSLLIHMDHPTHLYPSGTTMDSVDSQVDASPGAAAYDYNQILHQLQTQIHTLQSQLASLQAIPTPPPPAPKSIKIATPDVYTGDRSKTDTFLRQVALYVYGRPQEFQDDYSKIIFALSWMKGGTAGAWADQMVDHLTQSRSYFSGWLDFEAKFKAIFADPDKEGSARHR